MKVVVTGSNGFVGQTLTSHLAREGWQTAELGRREVGNIGPETDWMARLAGADAVIHLAAMVHVMHEPTPEEAAGFHTVNALGTEKLALDAGRAGVRRLVFLSTSKVMGDRDPGRPFTEADHPAPGDPYTRSKLEGEERLRTAAAASGLEFVILRPPLVYGPGVKANFLSLLRLCASPWPLPLESVANERSFISVDNLCDAIVRCVSAPSAAGLTAFVRDGTDLSTPQLITNLRREMSRPVRLVPVPSSILKAATRLLGRTETATRLLDSFRFDDSLFRRTLDWSPPQTAAEGLSQVARWFVGLS